MTLALAGGVIGAVTTYFWLNGYQATTLNWTSFSQVAFAFLVTPKLMLLGLGTSMLMGLLGGVFPAIHAARTPIAVALREL